MGIFNSFLIFSFGKATFNKRILVENNIINIPFANLKSGTVINQITIDSISTIDKLNKLKLLSNKPFLTKQAISHTIKNIIDNMNMLKDPIPHINSVMGKNKSELQHIYLR